MRDEREEKRMMNFAMRESRDAFMPLANMLDASGGKFQRFTSIGVEPFAAFDSLKFALGRSMARANHT